MTTFAANQKRKDSGFLEIQLGTKFVVLLWLQARYNAWQQWKGVQMIDGVARNEGKITVFHLKDDLTRENVKSFVIKMNELVEEGRVHLVLDLENVYEVSLLGMMAISYIFNRCRQAGGAFKIAQLTPPVRKGFRLSNLINTVEVYDDVIDAVKSFRSQNLLRSKHFSGSFFVKEKNAFFGWDRLPVSGPLH